MFTDYEKTRRSFLTRMAAVTGLGLTAKQMFGDEPTDCAGPTTPTPVKWTKHDNPIKARVSASTLAGAELKKLRDAYDALRKLTVTDPNDPRGWLQQGDKHCWNCGGGLDGKQGEEIHGSWLFLPWHRAFLYFHERILGELIHDENLRLSYWEWDKTSDRPIPAAFTTPNNSSNSLFDANRSAVAGNSLPASIVGPTIMHPIVNAADFATFGGDASNAGDLENGPHGAVHIWCGDTTLASAKADMGILDTAAQDPIFFAHHSNIDRLWNVWLAKSSSHQNPTDSSWLEHRFTFWDEKKRWVYITIADVINMTTNLRYTYGEAGAEKSEMETAKTQQLQLDSEQAITIPKPSASAKLTLLRLNGISVPQSLHGGVYWIVAGEPGPSLSASPESSNYLGYVAILPKTSKDTTPHLHGSLNIDLDVTGKLSPLAEQQHGKMRLSLVPAGNTSASTLLRTQSVYLVEQ